MRILFTADPELPVPPKLYGGLERIIYGLVKGLEERGQEVAMIGNSSSEIDIDNLYFWNNVSSKGKINAASNILKLLSVEKKFKPDLIHSFSRLLYMLPLFPKNLKKIMSYGREPTKSTVSNSLKISRNTLSFTGCSDYISDIGRSYGGNWITIHNFVDIDIFKYEPIVSNEAPLVFLSRIERIKGAHNAIKVALETGKKLIIAGNADYKSSYWKNEIEPYLNKDGIKYIGPVDDNQKNNLLGNAVAMIVPIEWNEPFGIVFIESLACGTPVISCPKGGLPEIIINGKNGFLCDSFEEMCNSVEQISSINRLVCRKTVEKNFSSDHIIDKYHNYYKSLF